VLTGSPPGLRVRDRTRREEAEARTAARSVALLTAAARHVSGPQQHRLFEEGAPADRLRIIDAGEVALDLLQPGAGRLTIATLGRGDVVGLSWLVPPYQWRCGS